MLRHWKLRGGVAALAFSIALVTIPHTSSAQDIQLAQAGHQHHPGMVMPAKKDKASTKKKAPKPPKKHPAAHKHGAAQPASHQHRGDAAGAAHGGHGGAGAGAAHEHGGMKGFLGPYAMTREGSGTSWMPDTTPHEGIHATIADWQVMWHALFNGAYDKQGGPRGEQKTFASGMIMGMAQRQLGDGTLGFRAMLSPDPFMGPSGYPLLFASGETANGVTPLIDRQHPHELVMELATTYSHKLSANSSVFVYAGLPGEPAFGPPAFMHRTSGLDIPEAPITHHWLDSTHITFGVVTVGATFDNWKIETSAFRGREPDQHRFDIEAPKLDSFSARLSWNPIRELSTQVSFARIHSPEGLEPDVDEDRLSVSATFTQPFWADSLWSTTAAWGRKIQRPGETLDGFLLESALIFQKRYTVFMRAERVDSHELLHNTPGVDPALRHTSFPVAKISLGGIYDIPIHEHVKFGIGGLVSKYAVPNELKPFYGSDPTSYMVFVRLKVS
ncbi:MAG: hypothetical protein QOD94_1266 [Alphaproteobacteria bacterium]|jgi:hypothetical protein|nr:hypothetical protein [Alphaproteobacteria bacterium]